MYIVFEGIVGSGKSTQSKMLYEYLKKRLPDKEILLTREPGGTEIAEAIRKLVQGTEFSETMDPMCEAYLYAASRAQLIRKKIKPVLEKGGIVISDRSYISSLSFQGAARGLGIKKVMEINKEAVEPADPDIIIFLHISPEEGLKRAFDKEGDKFESKGIEFFKKIEQGYKKISLLEKFNKKWININVKGNKEEVFSLIIKSIKPYLNI